MIIQSTKKLAKRFASQICQLSDRKARTISESRLLREYVKDHLYNIESGYFSQCVKIGGAENQGIAKPILFNKLFDEYDFRLKLKATYKQGAGAWLTPMEVFHPWYGRAIADRIVQAATRNYTIDPPCIEIFEIGGGSGTGMIDILDRIHKSNPRLYSKTRYTSIEISPRLAKAQIDRAAASRHSSNNWDVIEADFLDLDRMLPLTDETAFVLAFEVLDNLPHDKIVFGDDGTPWEAVIYNKESVPADVALRLSSVVDFVMGFTSMERRCQESECFYERFRPSTDSLILKTIELLRRAAANLQDDVKAASLLSRLGNFVGGGRLRHSKLGVLTPASAIASRQGIVYIPTGHVQFLEALRRCIPQHALILSDFDALPGLVMKGAGGPAIQSIGAGHHICERSSYLLPKNVTADIMFPTDFLALEYMYKEIIGQPCRVETAREFFSRHEESRDKCTTMSGYCPLVEYYSNTSYLSNEPTD